jgi:putative acetyltransferase
MIRKYKEEDIEAVISSWRLSSELAHPFLTQESLDQESDNVRNVYMSLAETWVTEVNDHVVGFISLIENEIGGLFLDPTYHRRGFGRAMVDMAVSEKGALLVEVFKENSIGRGFYNSYGFLKVDEFVHEASGQTTFRMSYSPE